MGLMPDGVQIDPTAVVHPEAQIGAGTIVGPHAVIGQHVRIGRRCRVGASAVVDGWTEIGDENEIFPFASIGLIPQDLKFRGEETRLVIGRRNVFREFVTIHRGTRGGGGVTRIGDRNVFMAYAHVAHDCEIGHETIFGNGATLGGHVLVEDQATISAFSGVHQFCRVGRQAFVGGYSVVTKDALPYAKTVGNRARIYGLNTVGLSPRRVLHGDHREAEGNLSLPAAVEAQHHSGTELDRQGPDAQVPRGAVSGGLHPYLQARREPAAATQARRGSGGGGVRVPGCRGWCLDRDTA